MYILNRVDLDFSSTAGIHCCIVLVSTFLLLVTIILNVIYIIFKNGKNVNFLSLINPGKEKTNEI